VINKLILKKMKELQAAGMNRRQIARAIGKTDYFVYYWLVVKDGGCCDASFIEKQESTYNSVFQYADKIKKETQNGI
jgi:hypothetical protein